MKDLDNLRQVADDMLSDLSATPELRARILRAAKEEKREKRGKRALVLRAGVAAACACAVLALAVILPRSSSPVLTADPALSGQAAGGSLSPENSRERALLDMPQGSVTLSAPGETPAYKGLWASASGGNFPLVCVSGRYYRLMTHPASVGSDQLGALLGVIDSFTSEPALAQSAIFSNCAQAGQTVYAVSGMGSALVAAQVDGVLRVFQRVSFSGNALLGGESLSDTLGPASVTGLEISGLGSVTDASAAQSLYNTLIGNAVFRRAGGGETNQALLIRFSNGFVLQMAVKDDSLVACGTWDCPEFFEAFKAVL